MDEDTDYRPQKKRAHGLESHDNSPPFGGDFEAFQIAVEAVKHGHIAETEKQNEDQRDEFGRIQWQGAVGRVGHGIVNLLPENVFQTRHECIHGIRDGQSEPDTVGKPESGQGPDHDTLHHELAVGQAVAHGKPDHDEISLSAQI